MCKVMVVRLVLALVKIKGFMVNDHDLESVGYMDVGELMDVTKLGYDELGLRCRELFLNFLGFVERVASGDNGTSHGCPKK